MAWIRDYLSKQSHSPMHLNRTPSSSPPSPPPANEAPQTPPHTSATPPPTPQNGQGELRHREIAAGTSPLSSFGQPPSESSNLQELPAGAGLARQGALRHREMLVNMSSPLPPPIQMDPAGPVMARAASALELEMLRTQATELLARLYDLKHAHDNVCDLLEQLDTALESDPGEETPEAPAHPFSDAVITAYMTEQDELTAHELELAQQRVDHQTELLGILFRISQKLRPASTPMSAEENMLRHQVANGAEEYRRMDRFLNARTEGSRTNFDTIEIDAAIRENRYTMIMHQDRLIRLLLASHEVGELINTPSQAPE